MNLASLTAEVYGITNRPDLVSETKSAIKAATLKMHQIEYWDRDLFETGAQFIGPEFIQNFYFSNLIPRWRAVKYFRKVDPISYVPMGEFNIITPDSALDAYGFEREEVAYLAGNYFQLRSRVKFQYIILGCYLNPDVTDAGYSSWIAQLHPYAIIFEACRVVFKNIGLDAEEVAYRNLVAEQVVALTTSNLQAKGY